MEQSSILNHIVIEESSATPKYKQIINSIISAIDKGMLKRGDRLPSLNTLYYNLEISKDSVEKSYNHLRKIGVVNAFPGKGYYIANTDVKETDCIFLLFNKLSQHKKIIYDAFVSTLGAGYTADFYIYNDDPFLFRRLLKKQGNYAYYVIIPPLDDDKDTYTLINEIPKNKLVLLDRNYPYIEGEYAAAYQNFRSDIYNALVQARETLSKYHTIKVIIPNDALFSKDIIKGCMFFCQDYAFCYKAVKQLPEEPIKEGEAFICLTEADLVLLVERLLNLGLKPGRQVGIISYNETPLKKIILEGITTISTDFHEMGRMAAQLIKDRSLKQVEIPFYLKLRYSL